MFHLQNTSRSDCILLHWKGRWLVDLFIVLVPYFVKSYKLQKCSLESAVNIIWMSCSKKIFALCLTSQRNSGWIMKYIYVYDCFDVCSWVQRIWYKCESACGWACVRVCGSSSGLLKACWEACHCKSGKGKSPKCTEERTHHPPLSLSVSLSPLLPRSLLFPLTLSYTISLLQYISTFMATLSL